MGWRTKILAMVRRKLNGLGASGQLSRRGMLRAYNSVYFDLPQNAHRFRGTRYVHDPNCFIYTVRFVDQGARRRFVFYVNDVIRPGLLVVDDMDYVGP